MNNTTYMGMEIALRGLYSAQRGMANVAHNVDNVNTPLFKTGSDQRAARPLLVANSAGMLGMGSDVVSVDRMRDTFWMKSTGAKPSILVNGSKGIYHRRDADHIQ